jgi:hypothetical protein
MLLTPTLYLALAPQTAVTVQQEKDRTVIDNGRIRLTLDTKTGGYDVEWKAGAAASHLYGEIRLADGRLRKTTEYARHDVTRRDVKDAFGTGVQVTLRHRAPQEPELRQIFWVYGDRPEAIVRMEATAPEGVASNYLAPIVTESPVQLRNSGELQSLFVPYDNDMYFRYRSDGWGEGEGDGDGSYEVGALYDDRSRKGIVIGSLDHLVWKSAVRFKRGGGVRAYAGVTSKYTHDTQPHGTVSGKTVQSPRMLLGHYTDWRDGMERFGDLNAIVRPPLAWKGDVPFGWNSWAGHKAKLNEEHGRVATDFIAKDLPEFRNDGTAYINFDSFWDNLTKAQRADFVKRAHAAGLKAGIYFTPFTGWGGLDGKVNGTSYTFQDIVLKDAKGEPLPKLSGGYPLDPTHPGTQRRNDLQMAEFVELGFDFVKFDFMSHGALEGKHYDPKVPTGTAAYAVGMQLLLDSVAPKKIGRPFFISLSIAPMFPQGFGHSRRISCDVFANIGATEYLLNSSNYGWWTNRRIYQFNDPDHTCVYQPMDEQPTTEAEARSRTTASVISGGMLLQGDDLTKPEARARTKQFFTNEDVLTLARRGLSFRPVNGDTATKGGDAFTFVERDGKTAYLALFNFEKAAATKSISLARAGLDPRATWSVRELWTGAERQATGSLEAQLAPMDCTLVRLERI